MPRISTCLIVRDEEAFLEECLASLVGVVDDVVVVDTGSRDRTLEIAQSFPVSLHHFAWCDDFSAARNFALDQARGDWILYIDADERLTVPRDVDFHAYLDDTSAFAWHVKFHPRVGFTPYGEVRLFRNHPQIRFRGVIHERIHESLIAVSGRPIVETGLCPVTISHVGYEDDQSHKHPRNLPLLQAYLEREPGRIYCWWHMGETYAEMGEVERAEAAWLKGIEVLRDRNSPRPDPSENAPYVALLESRRKRGEDISDLLAEARGLFPNNLLLQLMEARHCLADGRAYAVLDNLERLAAIDAETFFDPYTAYDKTVFTRWAHEALALCLFRLGRYQEAAEIYRRVAAAHPEEPSYPIKAQLAEARAQG